MNEGHLLEAYEHLQICDYIKCITICNKILILNPRDDLALALKIQAIIEQNSYADVDLMVDNGIIDIMNTEGPAQPNIIKTSLLAATGNSRMDLSSVRSSKLSKSRPGYMRPETQLTLSQVTSHDGIRKALKTSKTSAIGTRMRTTTAQTARLATTAVNSALGVDGVDVARVDPRIYTNNLLLRQIIFDFLLFVQKNSVSALELLENIDTSYDSQPVDPWWRLFRTGAAHLMSGRLNEAERFLRQANSIAPRTDTYLLLGNSALRRSQTTTALNIYDSGIMSFSQAPDLDLAIARVYEIQGDKESALRMFERTLEQDPSCVEAIACAASLCMELRRVEKAFSLYTRLLVFDVKDPGVLANLGVCFQLMGDTTNALWFQIRAIEAAEMYLSQHGEEAEDYSVIVADMWYNIGLLFCHMADFFAASKCFSSALRLSPNHPEATTGTAFVATHRGKKTEANVAYDSLIEMDDAPAEGLVGSAHMALEKGDVELALTSAQRALFQPRGTRALRIIHAIKERIAMK